MNPAHHDFLAQILIWLIPAVPAITLHECAHGWMALRCGDTTARDAKRLSLNPIRHIDPVGTLLVPGLMVLAHMPFVFGWAKPVPVNFRQLKNGRIGIILVALAGPLANLLMLFGWLALAWGIAAFARMHPVALNSPLGLLGQASVAGIAINLVLMLFNLIPIPPLDGGRVIGGLLPQKWSKYYMRLDRFGMLILLVLIATGVFSTFFMPVVEFFFTRLDLM